ncbi:hypothetical protein LTR66_011753, partial [Elasticomyces elasticus]
SSPSPALGSTMMSLCSTPGQLTCQVPDTDDGLTDDDFLDAELLRGVSDSQILNAEQSQEQTPSALRQSLEDDLIDRSVRLSCPYCPREEQVAAIGQLVLVREDFILIAKTSFGKGTVWQMFPLLSFIVAKLVQRAPRPLGRRGRRRLRGQDSGLRRRRLTLPPGSPASNEVMDEVETPSLPVAGESSLTLGPIDNDEDEGSTTAFKPALRFRRQRQPLAHHCHPRTAPFRSQPLGPPTSSTATPTSASRPPTPPTD